ncbi:pyruvate oxidase [Roseibium hamelinense]|uniref:Pyruvate oxidase n=1 Tax=Roseibium hamelinense TaxID=150831 RepID=A0A562T935_9HYPH|nr:thiamine pyrophosphate-dependent enzyme [Roseibium hamelinense]MTI45516.1 pyruvate oxidase [Roseibium hamelinense]TWI90109.1 pyruvate oxidase [Roseibium hamelinense]
MNVAELIIETLHQHGVRHVFGIPGDAICDFTYALKSRQDMDFILVRHEEAGAFAASAQAKLSGELACCMGTAGGGAIHLLNGLYDAKLDRAPVLAITGQVQTEFVGTGYHQEVDTERLFADACVYSKTVMDEGQLPALIMEACKAAISERAPAHLSVPTNVAGRKVAEIPSNLTPGLSGARMRPCDEDLKHAADLINKAEKPVILAGLGAGSGGDQVIALAKKIKAPIARTLRAKDWIDESHPDCIGGLGLLGGVAGSKSMEHCDLLVMIGTDYPYVDFYPKKAKVIQIDIDVRNIGKRTSIDVPLHGHTDPTVGALLELVNEKSDDSFKKDMTRRHEEERRHWTSDEGSDHTPVRPQTLLHAVSTHAPDNAVFLCDTGTITAWSARHLIVKETQRFTASACLGTMAFAMSGSIGAQLKYPDRPVAALCGDGAFAMLMADFVTAVRYDLPVTVIVLENKKLGFIALEQEGKGLPEHSIDLVNPDFVAFARACGGEGIQVSRPEELDHALKTAFSNGKATVVNVETEPGELIMPPQINARQAYHFGLAKVREAIEPIKEALGK